MQLKCSTVLVAGLDGEGDPGVGRVQVVGVADRDEADGVAGRVELGDGRTPSITGAARFPVPDRPRSVGLAHGRRLREYRRLVVDVQYFNPSRVTTLFQSLNSWSKNSGTDIILCYADKNVHLISGN